MDRWGIELLSQADFHSGLTPLDCAVYVGKEALVRMLVAGLGSGDDSAASELLEQARRRVLEPHAPLALFRGLPWAVKLGPDSVVVELSAFSTLQSTYSCPLGSKGYYEVQILGLDSTPQYGFATAAFEIDDVFYLFLQKQKIALRHIPFWYSPPWNKEVVRGNSSFLLVNVAEC